MPKRGKTNKSFTNVHSIYKRYEDITQEDPRRFGGNIPAAPKSVEFVTVGSASDNTPNYAYQSYEGTPLKKVSTQQGLAPGSRTAYLLDQRVSVMPD